MSSSSVGIDRAAEALRGPRRLVDVDLDQLDPAGVTITVYRHIIPGMQADAATVFSNLVAGVLPPTVPAREVVDNE